MDFSVFNNVIMLLLAFLIPYLTGYFLVSIIERSLELRFRILFAIPLGFSVSSIMYFLYKTANFNHFAWYKIFEIILLITLALIYYNEEKPNINKHKFKKLSIWFYLLNLYSILIFLKYFIINPMGSWDGFRIWNIKAEFLYTDNPLWINIFELPHFLSHNDYPLFLPASIARIWEYLGNNALCCNITFCLIFTLGLIYLLYQSIEFFKSKKIALVITSVFMISDIFLVNGASQCADIPIAYFFLSTIICLFFFFKRNKISYLILGSIFASLSIWVKNEGILFLLVYTLTIIGILLSKRDYRNILTPIIFSTMSVIILSFYKKLTATENDLIVGFFAIQTWKFFFDISRYFIILKSTLSTIIYQFGLTLSLLILAIKGFKIKENQKSAFITTTAIIGLMTLGYFSIYLLSPHDIKWHVENSLDRIILQILPVILFTYSTTLRIGRPDSRN